MKSNRLLQYLKSNNFALLIAILSVAVQSFHSFTAFYNTSGLKGTAWGIAQAALFALIVDMAILFYTLRRRSDIARIAALAMVVINAYYYFQHLGLNLEFIFGVFLSLIIPVSVYFYSEEIGKDEATDVEYESAADAWERLKKLQISYTGICRELKESQEIEKRNQKNYDELAGKYLDAENVGTMYAGKIDQLNGKITEGDKLVKQLYERIDSLSKLNRWQADKINALQDNPNDKGVVSPPPDLKFEDVFVTDREFKVPDDNPLLVGMDHGLPGGDKTVMTIFTIGPDGPEIVSSEEVDSIPFETATSAREEVADVDYEEPEGLNKSIEESLAKEDLRLAKRSERLRDAIRNRNFDVIDKIAAEENKDRWLILEEAKENVRKYNEENPLLTGMRVRITPPKLNPDDFPPQA